MHCHFLFELMQLISGPRVESMFSEMGNFLTDQRSRVKMETYNTQHMIKMHFRGDVIEKLHRSMCCVAKFTRAESWLRIWGGQVLSTGKIAATHIQRFHPKESMSKTPIIRKCLPKNDVMMYFPKSESERRTFWLYFDRLHFDCNEVIMLHK